MSQVDCQRECASAGTSARAQDGDHDSQSLGWCRGVGHEGRLRTRDKPAGGSAGAVSGGREASSCHKPGRQVKRISAPVNNPALLSAQG